MNNLTFTFSDLISGYVTSYNEAEKLIGIKTSDGREFEAKLTGNTYAKLSQNLGEDWPDRSGELHKLLVPGQMIFVYGTFFPENKVKFEVNYILFAGDGKDQYRYADEPGWWIKQIDQIASSYCEWQFNAPTQDIDYNNYRTIINLTGGKEQEDYLQETDTISRMVYGMACAYMLTCLLYTSPSPRD